MSGKIIKFPKKDDKRYSNEGILKLLDAIYNDGELEDGTKVLKFPNGYEPTEYEKYHNLLASMNAYHGNQELREYIERIDKCVTDFDKYSSALKGFMLKNNYNVYRKKIINIILEYTRDFCIKYNFLYSYNSELLNIDGIEIYIDREDFSLEYIYNTLVNIANFVDDFGPKR